MPISCDFLSLFTLMILKETFSKRLCVKKELEQLVFKKNASPLCVLV